MSESDGEYKRTVYHRGVKIPNLEDSVNSYQEEIIVYLKDNSLLISAPKSNNMAQPYLCELINKKESHVNTRLGTDHHQLIMPPIVRIVLTLFLSVHSFMLLHANGTN